MTVLKLNLFGAFLAQTDDADAEAISFRSDKIRALLVYLAVEGGRLHRRESLAALFWPDYSDKDALHNLRNSLYRLRQSFDDPLSDRLLTVDRQIACLNVDLLQLDVASFKTLLDNCAGHQHQSRQDCAECIERLQKAADLYQGEFLEGFVLSDAQPFEEWELIYRERFHQQALAALYDLSAFYRRQGQYGLARKYAARQVVLEPWLEIGHRQMMEALALDGRLDDALAQFESCCRILEKEVGVEPSPETISLYEQIRDSKSGDGPFSARIEAPADTAAQPAYNLPRQFTHFVGRQSEVNDIAEQLADPNCALLTIVGPGGMGKTRLAIEVARQRIGSYAHGVWFISLAPVQAVEDIPAAVAASLPLPPVNSADIERQILNYLSDKQALLVMDNFEHLLDGAGFLLTLLERAPQIKILATSRERLNLRAEWVFEIQGLSRPTEATGNLMSESYPAVQLFIQHLQQINRSPVLTEEDIQQIGRICTLVEGVPLAIELATNLTATRSFSEIAELIRNDLGTLKTHSRDVPERQRSMRAVFDHSWELLNEDEQKALRSIAIFPASFTLEAAVEVTGAAEQCLRSLTEKSFLRRSENGRFEMHVLLSQFATEKLHQTASVRIVELLHERFNVYYMTFLQQYKDVLNTSGSRAAVLEIRQEIDNIRLAWDAIVSQSNVPEIARSFPILGQFCDLSGQSREGNRLLQMAINAVDAVIPKKKESLSAAEKEKRLLMTRLLLQQNRFQVNLALVAEGMAAVNLAIEHARICEDTDNLIMGQVALVRMYWRQGLYKAALDSSEIALQLSQQTDKEKTKLMVSFQKAIAQIFMGDFIPARQCFERLMPYYEAQGDELYVAALHMNLGTISLLEGKYIEAREHFEQGLETYRQIGSFFGEATAFAYLSWLSFHEQRYILALDWGRRALTAMRDIGEVIREAAALVDVGNVYARLGQWETAQTHYEQALSLSRPVNNRNSEIGALYNLSLLTCQLGDFQQALALSKQALQMVEKSGDRYLHAHCLTVQGRALESLGQIEAALDAYMVALTLRHEMNQFNLIAELRALSAHLHLHQGDLEQAMACIEDVLEHLGFSERPNNQTGRPAAPSIDRLHGVQAPFQVCLICYELLTATGDERSAAVMDFAVRALEEQAQQIDDPRLKQSFLENVPAHRAFAQRLAAKA